MRGRSARGPRPGRRCEFRRCARSDRQEHPRNLSCPMSYRSRTACHVRISRDIKSDCHPARPGDALMAISGDRSGRLAPRRAPIVPCNKKFNPADRPNRTMLGYASGHGGGAQMLLARVPVGLLMASAIAMAATVAIRAQPAASGPPAAGVVDATKRPITETSEFLARIQPVNQAQVQAAQINLDYPEIRSPIDGKIGRTAVTEGNVVSPGSGVLTTIVSQDPMYVLFPVSVRQGLELRERYATRGGLNAVVIKLRLPDGRPYDQTGKLDFVDNTITQSTDTFTVRGAIPNPTLHDPSTTGGPVRELTDGEFVTVLLEGVQPVEVLAIPRAAVLSDQQGDYVFVVGPDNKAEQRRIQLGQSTSTVASVLSGLAPGEKVVVEGLQRVRPGQPIAPGPASPLIQSSMKAGAGDSSTQIEGSAAGGTKPAGNSK